MEEARVIDADFTVLETTPPQEAVPCKWCKGPATDKRSWVSFLGQPVPFCMECASRINFLANTIPIAFEHIRKMMRKG